MYQSIAARRGYSPYERGLWNDERPMAWPGWQQFSLGALMYACLVPCVIAFLVAIFSAPGLPPLPQAQLHLLTASQLNGRIDRVHDELAATTSLPGQYYDNLNDAYLTEALINVYEKHGGDRALLHMTFPSFTPEIDQMMRNYIERYGMAVMQKARAGHTVYGEDLRDLPPVDFGWAKFLCLLGYLCSLAFAYGYFFIALTRKGLNPWFDLDRVTVAVLTWPYAMLTYPTEAAVIGQIRRARRRIGVASAAFLSVAPAGAFAKAMSGGESTPEVDGHDSANTLSLLDLPQPALSLDVTMKSNKVGGNGKVLHHGLDYTWTVNAAFNDGWSFDFAGTKSLYGANSSDEWDLEGFKSGTLSFGPAYSVGLHYYGIRPWHTLIDGNFAAATFSLDEPVGYGVHLFVNGEYDHIISHAREDGYQVQLGASRGFNLGHGVAFNESVSLVQAGGPFELKAVTLGRYDASLGMPITDTVSVKLWLKQFVPLAGANDRHDGSVGMSLDYAF
jgi:hypothetical protein